MTVQAIVSELKSLGSESIKRVLLKHGAREPFFGVKVEHLKKIRRRIKTDHSLALGLYDTGISDAMYLAGLIADDAKMTKKDLQHWADGAYWYLLSEFTIPWVAAGSHYGWEMGNKWIESRKESIAAAGWATFSSLVAVKADEELEIPKILKLLTRIEKELHDQPNRVRHTMNGFIIAAGAYVSPLTEKAIAIAEKIGVVSVDIGDTACKVPYALDYIDKIKKRGALGKKKKTAKC